jgi:hypothetical protein
MVMDFHGNAVAFPLFGQGQQRRQGTQFLVDQEIVLSPIPVGGSLLKSSMWSHAFSRAFLCLLPPFCSGPVLGFTMLGQVVPAKASFLTVSLYV